MQMEAKGYEAEVRHSRNHGQMVDNLKLFFAITETKNECFGLHSLILLSPTVPSRAVFFLSMQILFLTQSPV